MFSRSIEVKQYTTTRLLRSSAGTTMAIGSWEVIHVAAGYAAILYYIVTRFYFAAEELESSLSGFVSTLYCSSSSSFSPSSFCHTMCCVRALARLGKRCCLCFCADCGLCLARFVFFVSLVHSSICCNLFSTEENENSKPPPSCCKSRCSVRISTACVLALQYIKRWQMNGQ